MQLQEPQHLMYGNHKDSFMGDIDSIFCADFGSLGQKGNS